MKIAVGDEEIFKDLKKIGKAVLVVKNGKNECCAKLGESLQITADARNLREVLECLADLGFDFAILKGFDLEVEGLEKGMGVKIPKATKLEHILKAPEIETLKSVVEKVKKDALDCGAVGIFIGVARAISEGKKVKMLEYEAYQELLAEKVAELENNVKRFPGIRNAKLFHKLGVVMPGEDIVYIAVAGQHRKDIWAPLILAVELMKTELPIWKKEIFENGARWV
ncbi:MAG: molybdenum cofactor biosynthesis protein MoaE [Archaeoglobaceae archaeon]